MFDFQEIASVTLILFSVIDILGSLPIVIELKRKAGGKLQPFTATWASAIIMIIFLFLGEKLLELLGIDVASFAVAGAIVIFFIGLEMVLGVTIFKDTPDSSSTSIVPLAFPLIAGTGTLTTLLSLRSQYQILNILIGIIINLILVYAVLYYSDWIEQKIGKSGTDVLRKVFGIILLAIAVKLVKTYFT
ncbi:MAG: NAAT family transporter [Cytophagales bacterium]|nr:NAAT family transporter [Cytophagales bacterium]MDW8384514.1 MarC family protein [Flammeovirgaceae bacterium]